MERHSEIQAEEHVAGQRLVALSFHTCEQFLLAKFVSLNSKIKHTTSKIHGVAASQVQPVWTLLSFQGCDWESCKLGAETRNCLGIPQAFVRSVCWQVHLLDTPRTGLWQHERSPGYPSRRDGPVQVPPTQRPKAESYVIPCVPGEAKSQSPWMLVLWTFGPNWQIWQDLPAVLGVLFLCNFGILWRGKPSTA